MLAQNDMDTTLVDFNLAVLRGPDGGEAREAAEHRLRQEGIANVRRFAAGYGPFRIDADELRRD